MGLSQRDLLMEMREDIKGLRATVDEIARDQALGVERRASMQRSADSIYARPDAHFADLATPVRARWTPWIGVLATPSEVASAADAGRRSHPLILTSSRSVAGPMAG